MSTDRILKKVPKPLNPSIATRVSSDVESSKPLSPRYFLPEDGFKFKVVSNCDGNTQTPVIPRSTSFTNVESEQSYQNKVEELSRTYEHCLKTRITQNECLIIENEKLLQKNRQLAEINFTKDEIIRNLEIELKKYSDQMKYLSDSNEAKDAKLKRISQDNEDLSQEFKEIQMRNRKACNTYEYQIDDLNKEVTTMRNELNSVKASNNDLLEQIKEYRTQLCQLNQLIACLKNQNDAICNNEHLLKQEKESLEHRVSDLLLENEKLVKLSFNSTRGNGKLLVSSSSVEINEIGNGEEKVFWKRMIKTIKLTSKEKDIKKNNRLSGNLKLKKVA